MKASEAKELAKEKQPTLEEVLKQIEASAKTGEFQYGFRYLSSEIVLHLMKLGYKTTIEKDVYMFCEVIIVSWI